MELEFPVVILTGISAGLEVTWSYHCIAKEVEKKGSTAVRYQIQQLWNRPYTLECIHQNLVSVKLLHKIDRVKYAYKNHDNNVWTSLFDG